MIGNRARPQDALRLTTLPDHALSGSGDETESILDSNVRNLLGQSQPDVFRNFDETSICVCRLKCMLLFTLNILYPPT